MSSGATILGRIVAHTREQVHARRRQRPLHQVLAAAPTPESRRPFAEALTTRETVNVIAEFKRRSPSAGLIREDMHVVRMAQAYEIGGAAALSILTEEQFFGGNLDDLQQARAGTLLPTLRKDFVVDPYQVKEAWIAGADAVLLIVTILDQAELSDLHALSLELGLEPLVEVHDREELSRALELGAKLIGVNNRNLRTMQVHLETSLELAEQIPEDVVAVAESGIRTGRDIRKLRAAGFRGFLVGEHLMRSADPAAALERLIAEAQAEGD
jgi:indole-3-glycerol phosphate synthase